jgi:hypothetical protein
VIFSDGISETAVSQSVPDAHRAGRHGVAGTSRTLTGRGATASPGPPGRSPGTGDDAEVVVVVPVETPGLE